MITKVRSCLTIIYAFLITFQGHLIGLITPKASNKIPVRHYDLAGDLTFSNELAHSHSNQRDLAGRPIGIIHLESTPLLRAASATAPPALAPAKSATSGIVDSHFAKHIGQHSSIQVSTSHHHAPDPSSGPESDNEPQLWDGWPNGTWTRFYTSQQVQTTSGLEIQWASEAFGPRKGSPSSKTWQRGKTMSRRCLGCIQCFNDFCGISSPPAARGIHISQQLEARCPCGAVLKHQTCGIQWSFHFYASGARLEHSGDHLHPHFTHTISTPARGHSQFAEFQRKPKVPLAISMGAMPSITHTECLLNFSQIMTRPKLEIHTLTPQAPSHLVRLRKRSSRLNVLSDFKVIQAPIPWWTVSRPS
jgi:hypothetical protein